jgi:hypothetical protein
MADSRKRSRRIPKPGIQAQHKAGRAVSADELRRIFREASIQQRIDSCELKLKILYNVHLDPPLPDEPPCVHSQRRAYLDTDSKKVTEVHCYERPNGTLAASGLLDPKEVVHDGVLYYYDRQ